MFWLCVVLAVLNLAGEVYLAAHGIHAWAGVVMAGFWTLLAWVHSRRNA